ncbi:tyrosine-type recombinase/integrase [Nocardia aobensis]|uniref:Tyrosine-type recombinase/integrase n=1 Tax=Nocardia aobensis TaxID=257277 RepID=A0ABW6P9C3_9NOCA
MSYVVRWVDPDGVERSESFAKRGRYDQPGTAEHYKHQLETRMARGMYVDPDLAKVLLKVEVDKWIRRARTETTRYQRQNFANNLGDLASMAIGAIRPSDIRDWLDHLRLGRPWCQGRALGENSVALQFQFLFTVLNIAAEDGVIVANPCRKVERPSRPDAEKSPAELLTVEQIRSLIRHSNRQTGCMMLLTAQTGLRPSEVAGLRVCDVDFLRRKIFVVQQANHFRGKAPTARLKTPRSKRSVPLPAEAHRELSAFLATVERGRSDLLFYTKAGRPWSADGMGQRFREIAAKAGVPRGFTWHDLRHFYASALIAKGASVKTVQARLGHASANVTLQVYTHLWPDHDSHTVSAIDDIFHPSRGNPQGVPEKSEVDSDDRREEDGSATAT